MKKRIFIGSSSEQLSTLDQVKDLLGDDFECIPWTAAFDLNKSGLDSLLKQTRLSDFSILIATKDDLTNQRGEMLTKARDNVIFEFGLFLGSAGVEQCYLLAEEGTNLPTDLDGITVAMFSRTPDQYNSLNKIVDNIKEQLAKSAELSRLGLLPSTALAIGYYNSFIRKVCEAIHHSRCLKVGERQINVDNFELHIIIPDDLDDDGINGFATLYNRGSKFEKASTCDSSSSRGYPLYFKTDSSWADSEKPIDIYMSDIPSTLNTIVECLKLYIPSGDVGKDFDKEYLEKRELDNFAKVLAYLINRNATTRNFVFVNTNVKI